MEKKNMRKRNGNGKKAERHSCIDSAVQALKTAPMVSKEEWIKQADKLYFKHGGASNISQSRWPIRQTLSEDGTLSLRK